MSATLFNDRPDMCIHGGPARPRPGTRLRLRLDIGSDWLNAVDSELAGAPWSPRWSYATSWFAWELLRRRRNRDPKTFRFAFPYHQSQAWWHWDRPFPYPEPRRGDPPTGASETARALMRWLEPPPPMAARLLPFGQDSLWVPVRAGADRFYPGVPRVAAAPGDPMVYLAVDLRATDEDVCRALRVLRRRCDVRATSRRGGSPIWGVRAPERAIELFDRHEQGERITDLARGELDPEGERRRRSRDPALVSMQRQLRSLFDEIRDAIVTDPLRPYRVEELDAPPRRRRKGLRTSNRR